MVPLFHKFYQNSLNNGHVPLLRLLFHVRAANKYDETETGVRRYHMKKKVLIIVIALILVVLLVPYNVNSLKDGGSKSFKSLTYEIMKVHRMVDDGYEDGIIIRILGFEIYNNVK